MTTKRKFKSDAFEAIHASAHGLHRVGAVDKATLREFDESCLMATPVMEPPAIKRIREQAHVSQPVFAGYLNTSESTLQKWGPVPSGPAEWRSSCWPWLKSTA